MQQAVTENSSLHLYPEQLVHPLNSNVWRCTKPAIGKMPVHEYTFKSMSDSDVGDLSSTCNVLDRYTCASNTCNSGKCPEGMQHELPTLSLYLRDVPPKGQGVFCSQSLSKDECITEYAGEVLLNGSELLQARCLARKKTLNTYMMPLGTLHTIDTTQYGNYGRYFNHSHDPNCYTKQVVHDGTPRLLIGSKLHIPPHTELTIDYGIQFDG